MVALSEEERQALIYLAVRLYESGFGFALLFFSGFCAAVGVLILRSRLLPAAIGVAMLLAGACYLVSTVTNIIAPTLASLLFPWILLPSFVGEFSLALWLLVKGIDIARAIR